MPLAIGSYVFTNSDNATLYVPAGTIDKYKATDGWKDFLSIEEGGGETPTEPDKCATPSINYADGKLSFDCATEGVEYVYEITFPNTLSGSNAEVTLSDQTMLVTVYAKKEGYENSETVTKEIQIASGGLQGDIDGNGSVSVADVTRLVDIIIGQ